MKKVLLVAIFAIAVALPQGGVSAAIPAVYTNDNFFSSEHEVPASFEQDLLGNFYGRTTTGKIFSQVNIENTLGVRLQKFSIDEAYYYITDRGIITAQNDITALSIYLTLAT